MRKELDVTITDLGRDQGKVFHLKEMPASRAEKWAMRALMLVARANADLGELAGMGMQGIAMLGIQSIMKIDFEDAEPLLDEMMECVSIKPDPKNPNVIRNLIDDDIEEIGTRIFLRQKIIELHVGFSMGGALSTPTSEPKEAVPPSSNIRTSPAPSVRSSRPARHR